MIPSKWFTVPVSVRPYLGSGSFGATLGDPVALLGNVDQRRRLVRDAGGFEVAAEMTVRIPPATAAIPDTSAVFVPESVVTAAGRTVKVITTKPFMKFGVPGYVELTTT